MSIQRLRNVRYSVRGVVAVNPSTSVGLSVEVSADPELIILTTSFVGTINVALSKQLQATGGTGGPYYWARTGSLPAGLSMTRGGVISGTPTSYGLFVLPVTVTDDNGNRADGVVGININPATLTLTVPTFPEGKVGDPYAHPVGDIQATGGVQPCVISVKSGSLPAGLSPTQVGVGQWQITGTPTERAVKIAVFRVTDTAATKVSATATIGITASVATTVTVTITQTLGSLTTTMSVPPYINQAPVWSSTIPTFTATVNTSAVVVNLSSYVTDPEGSALTYSIETGSVPGLTLSAGRIKGTPTSAGTYSLVVAADDGAVQPLRVVTSTLPTVNLSAAFDYTLVSDGGTGSKTWSLVSTLPSWATLSAGHVMGIALTVSAYPFTVRVTDGASSTADQALTLNVQSVPTDDFATRAAGTLYATDFSRVYHNGTLSYSLTSDSELDAEAYYGVSGDKASDRINLVTSPTSQTNKAMRLKAKAADGGGTSAGWRQSVNGVDTTIYRRFYAQFTVYYPREFLGYRHATSAGASGTTLKICNFGQFGGGQFVITHLRSTGFLGSFINGSPGLPNKPPEGIGAYLPANATPWSSDVYRSYNNIDTGVAGSTKTDFYNRYGPLYGSGSGLSGDCDLGYNASNPYVYNRTQPSGWPDTRAALNAPSIPMDDWMVVQVFLEYNTIDPSKSTVIVWMGTKGQALTNIIRAINIVPFNANTTNSWDSIELLINDANRLSEVGIRPDQYCYFGELITSLTPILPPGQTTYPTGNLG